MKMIWGFVLTLSIFFISSTTGLHELEHVLEKEHTQKCVQCLYLSTFKIDINTSQIEATPSKIINDDNEILRLSTKLTKNLLKESKFKRGPPQIFI